MAGIDIRGGCQGMPLELTGEWTGYNNGATMQVGLWIANDGEYIDWARRHAQEGPFYLRQVLTSLMKGMYRDETRNELVEGNLSLPASVWLAVTRSQGGSPAIDWAQITYDLAGSEPDEAEIAAAAKDVAEALEEFGVEDDTAWELAVRRREALAREIAMRGVQ
jgi:hypothetical protein